MAQLHDLNTITGVLNTGALQELLSNVHEIAMDQYGRKVLLYLLRPRDPHHFHPDVVKILQQGDNNPHRSARTANNRLIMSL